MASLVFVHGTGVREVAFKRTYETLEEGLAKRRHDIDLIPCYWADNFGARLHLDGKSIPTYDQTKAVGAETEEERQTQAWALLYEDPLLELRLLALQKAKTEALPPGQLSYSAMVHQDVAKFRTSPEFRTKAADTKAAELGLSDSISRAADLVDKFSKLGEAVTAAKTLKKTPDPNDAAREVIARAVVAALIAYRSGANVPLPDAEKRNELVRVAFIALGGSDANVEVKGVWGDLFGTILAPVVAIGKRGATWYLRNNRGAVTDAASPFPADILVYQAKGQPIREFIRHIIVKAKPPIYVLGHSLGGIAAFDLLAQTPSLKVAGLITVGSQVPFLYELGALTSLKVGDPLPDNIASWLNFYDVNDILSYIGMKIFGSRVVDVEVKSGQPFPEAHSAYWTTNTFWDRLMEFIK